MKSRVFAAPSRQGVTAEASGCGQGVAIPRLRLGVVSTALILLSASTVRADGAPQHDPNYWIEGGMMALLLLSFGAFIFLVRPPREP